MSLCATVGCGFSGRRWSPRSPFYDTRSGGGGSNVCLAVEEVRVVVFKVR